MLHNTPDWAQRHNFFHHSNPRSKPRSKDFFEKAHVRPQTTWAFDTLQNKESSDADRLKAKDVLHRLYNQNGSAAMFGGTCVQSACDAILITGTDESDAISDTLEMYKSYKPRDWDKNDKPKKDKYIDEIADVIKHALLGLKEAMARENRIVGEFELNKHLPGLALPHNTRPDYMRRGDLKTKWSKLNPKSKSGFSAVSPPKKLSGMFEMNNVFQAAGFWALNGHQPPFLVYASATDYQVFTPDNAPELQDDFLEDVVEHIRMHHKTTENLLRAASTKSDLLGLVSPNFSELSWQESPAYVEEAKKVWGLI